jgi:hypothetical protein
MRMRKINNDNLLFDTILQMLRNWSDQIKEDERDGLVARRE